MMSETTYPCLDPGFDDNVDESATTRPTATSKASNNNCDDSITATLNRFFSSLFFVVPSSSDASRGSTKNPTEGRHHPNPTNAYPGARRRTLLTCNNNDNNAWETGMTVGQEKQWAGVPASTTPTTAVVSPPVPPDAYLVQTGGNALQAVPKDILEVARPGYHSSSSNNNTSDCNGERLIAVAVPECCGPTMLVRTPGDNRLLQVNVPENVLPGHLFLVQVPPPMQRQEQQQQQEPQPASTRVSKNSEQQPLLYTGIPVDNELYLQQLQQEQQQQYVDENNNNNNHQNYHPHRPRIVTGRDVVEQNDLWLRSS